MRKDMQGTHKYNLDLGGEAEGCLAVGGESRYFRGKAAITHLVKADSYPEQLQIQVYGKGWVSVEKRGNSSEWNRLDVYLTVEQARKLKNVLNERF